MTEDEATWLDADELAAWLNIAELVTTLPGALDQRMQRHARISFYEYMVLAMLSEQSSGTLQLSELAELTAGSLSRLSHVLTRLERQGWVTRRRAPHNARIRQATLTEAGGEKVRAAAPGHVADVRSLIFDMLTPEQVRVLAELTAPVVGAMRPDGRFRPPGRARSATG